MNPRIPLALILCAMMPASVWAAQGDLPTKTSAPYIGVGVGYNTIDAGDGDVTIDGETTGYRLFGGYRFAQIPLPFNIDLGVEVGYVDLGEINDFTFGSDLIVELTGFFATSIVYLPISRHLDVFGKAGVYRWDGTVTADNTEIADESGTDLSLGLGIAWQTGTSFGAQLAVESLDAVDGVWMATLSATYQFK